MMRNVYLQAGLTLLGVVLATPGLAGPASAQATDCRAPGLAQYQDCDDATVTAVTPNGPRPDRPGTGGVGVVSVDVETADGAAEVPDAEAGQQAPASAAAGAFSGAAVGEGAFAGAGVPASGASPEAAASRLTLPDTGGGGLWPTMQLPAAILVLGVSVSIGTWMLRRRE